MFLFWQRLGKVGTMKDDRGPTSRNAKSNELVFGPIVTTKTYSELTPDA
jgi:hypothetical protein